MGSTDLATEPCSRKSSSYHEYSLMYGGIPLEPPDGALIIQTQLMSLSEQIMTGDESVA